MATKPSVHCPLCQVELAESEELEDHLVEEHTPRELADSIVSDWEANELGFDSE